MGLATKSVVAIASTLLFNKLVKYGSQTSPAKADVPAPVSIILNSFLDKKESIKDFISILFFIKFLTDSLQVSGCCIISLAVFKPLQSSNFEISTPNNLLITFSIIYSPSLFITLLLYLFHFYMYL